MIPSNFDDINDDYNYSHHTFSDNMNDFLGENKSDIFSYDNPNNNSFYISFSTK